MRIVRGVRPVELLSEEQLNDVHLYSLRLLQDIGLEFMLPESWSILEKNGAVVNRESGNARFPPDVVEHWVAEAPSEFELLARDPKKNVHLGGDHIVLGSASSAPNVMDLDIGRRPGNVEDFRNLVRLNQVIGSCGLLGGYPVEPIDSPANTRHLNCVYDFLTLSDKSFRLYGIGRTRARDGLAMIEIGHGIDRDELQKAPRTMNLLNVNSPLRVDGPLLEGSIELALNGQAIVVSPVAFYGAMSPITASGSLIQHNAECLACIAFLQMVNAGTPVFYGSLVTPTDMRTGAPAMGVSEAVTGTIAAGQMARRYGIPQRVMLGSTANAVDSQAAYETMFSLWAAWLSGAHFVHHAHGWMEAGLTTSYEKTVLDSDMIQMMAALAKPIELSDAEEALQTIADVGAGGHFLAELHTLKRYKTEFYSPMLSDWRPYEFWADDGAPDTAKRANAKWKELLADYQVPPMDPGIEEELNRYVVRRKEEIGSSEI